jgi:alkanesulfonate monooxygenase SsuD/methylene tetrahydromethanopterin reductase-like flavin-dependent oxidoreductase (luciferase family)
VKIGVLLPGHFTDSGDYLADARALDAAGVDSLWLPDDGFDRWLVLAAIATVTGRARLAASISARDCESPDALTGRMLTLDRLSRGRVLTTIVPAGEPNGIQPLIAHAHRIGPALVLLRDSGDGHAAAAARLADGLVSAADPAQCHAAFDQARLRRERERLSAPFELWTRAPAPEGREHWRGVLKSAAAVGATGLVVPFDPRLLDLLRNADEEDDRSDLTLAQG